jgi:hypothetical protein
VALDIEIESPPDNPDLGVMQIMHMFNVKRA